MATMKLTLLCACLLMFDAVESIRKKENEKNKEKGKKFREYCESAGNCKDDEAPVRRQKLKDDLVKIGANEADVEEALVKTLEAIKAMHKSYGVEDIDPVDDGTWSRDILLNPEQAQEIIDYYSVEEENNPPPTPEEIEQGKGKKKEHNVKKRATGLNFDTYQHRASRWTIPIPYFLASDFTTDEKDLITNALAAISSSSGCINFTELETDPDWSQEYSYIRLERYVPSCDESGCRCGLSFVGKQDQQQPTITMTGTGLMHNILHHIMHALGFLNEQQRMDRDSYVIVDPTCDIYLATYAKYENSVNYGTKYDFLSIMHYELGNCIQLSGTEGSEYADQIGKGQSLSELDIVGLKAYCEAVTCWDYYVECPDWDSFSHVCTNPDYAYLVPYCNHTCGQC